MIYVALLFCAFGVSIKLADDYFDLLDDAVHGSRWSFVAAGTFLLIAIISPIGLTIAVGETIACYVTGKMDRGAYWSGPLALLMGTVFGFLFVWERSTLDIGLYICASVIIFLGGCAAQVANNLKHDVAVFGVVPLVSRYGATISTYLGALIGVIAYDAVLYAFVYETSYGATKSGFRSYLYGNSIVLAKRHRDFSC